MNNYFVFEWITWNNIKLKIKMFVRFKKYMYSEETMWFKIIIHEVQQSSRTT
jgi:hypothetical protein